MASFSERNGYKEARSLVQRETLDGDTRVDLWNAVSPLRDVFARLEMGALSRDDETQQGLLMGLWMRFYRYPRDEFPGHSGVWVKLKSTLMKAKWNEALDLLEATVKQLDAVKTSRLNSIPELVAGKINEAFEHNLVAYRFIGFEITPIDSPVEADAVAAAIGEAADLAGARHHLERATELLADRQTPDYPNSIKESISAVEAVVKKVTGEGTLGKGLTKLEAAGLTIHPALKGAWSQMYGWTSNEDGIRHGGIDAADADQALAKYMLVTCSAFVSYLIEAGRKAGLI